MVTVRTSVAAAVTLGGLVATSAPARAAVFCNTAAVAGATSGASTPYPSNIFVAGMTGTVTDVNVRLLSFTTQPDVGGFHWAEDTDVLVAGPTGANVVVMSDAGGDNNNSSGAVSGANLTLDDQAANSLPADSLLTSGTFRPTDDDDDTSEAAPVDAFPAPAPAPSGSAALTAFNATNPNGTWRLFVADDTTQAANHFNGGWCIDILTAGGGTTPSLSVGDVRITEGDAGARLADFPVALTAPSASTVTVNYTTMNGTAVQPGDYTTVSGSLTFAAGQVSKTVSVPIKGDTLDESNESFSVRLSAPVNATIGDGVGVGTIRDDDPESGITMTISDVSNREGNSVARGLDFTVSLSAAAAATVTVSYATSNATAAEPGDYVAKSGTLAFSPGVVSRRVTVRTKADTLSEATESFRVTLSAVSGGGVVISDAIGVGTLVNDDV